MLGQGDEPVVGELNLTPINKCLRFTAGISRAALARYSKDMATMWANDRQSLPFKFDSFDLIISEFDAEYCGVTSLKHLTHYLRLEITVALICHHKAS